MTKQNLIILILGIIIVFLAVAIGLIFFSPVKNLLVKNLTNQAVKQPLPSQEELKAERIADVSNYDLALEKSDVNYCQKVQEVSTRNLCWEKLANKLNDSALCQNINRQEDKNRCIYEIVINKAFASKSLEPCNDLPSQSEVDKCKKLMQDSNFCPGDSCPNP